MIRSEESDLLEIDATEVAAKIRSGEYYQEAMRWYSGIYHAPLAERCYFVIITAMACTSTLIAVLALLALLPLRPAIPFTIISKDIFNDIPIIERLAEPGEEANSALKRYFVNNYVTLREGYDVNKLALNVNAIRSQSEGSVYSAYRNFMNPGNPRSPIARYERHTSREIKIVNTNIDKTKEGYTAKIIFEATEKQYGEARRSRFVSTLNFRYQNLTIDQESYKVTPMAFQVTNYDVKPLPAENQ